MSGRSDSENTARLQHDSEQACERMTERLRDIERELQTSGLASGLFELSDKNGETVMNEIIDTIKRNPIPAALTALGATWLIASVRNQTHKSENLEPWEEQTPGDDFKTRARESISDLGEQAQALRDSAAESFDEAGDRARTALGQVQGKISETASEIEHRLSGGADKVRREGQRLSRRAGLAGARAARRASELRDKGLHAGDTLENSMREQPVVYGALGLVLGAVAGALLPATRVEDEWLGPHRDNLRDAARDELSSRYDNAREQIREGVEDLTKSASERSV